MFGEFPSAALKQYCRYQRGLIVYHSTLYSRRSKCASFNICAKDETDRSKSVLVYGQVLFYFYVENEPFFFFKRYSRSKNLFSSLLKPIEPIPNWCEYLDRYFAIIRHSLSELVILPCSSILSKCIFIPFDAERSVCTRVELEIEHD